MVETSKCPFAYVAFTSSHLDPLLTLVCRGTARSLFMLRTKPSITKRLTFDAYNFFSSSDRPLQLSTVHLMVNSQFIALSRLDLQLEKNARAKLVLLFAVQFGAHVVSPEITCGLSFSQLRYSFYLFSPLSAHPMVPARPHGSAMT